MTPPFVPTEGSARGGPWFTVAVVMAVLALLGLPMVQWAGADLQAWLSLRSLFEVVIVLAGLLAVTISLQTLDAREQPRANVLVFGLTLAVIFNVAHLTVGQGLTNWPGTGPRPAAAVCLELLARWSEAATLLVFALRRQAAGTGLGWLAGASGLALPLVVLVASPLPGLLVGVPMQAWAWANAALMAAATLRLWRSRHGGHGNRQRLMLGAAVCLTAAAELQGLQAWPFQHAAWLALIVDPLRLAGYVLLFQAVYISGVKLPYERARRAEARMRDNELRLQLLGRNLPGSVLYQLERRPGGVRRFVHMGEAIERLLGLKPTDVMHDAQLFYERIHQEDATLHALAEEQSFRALEVNECTLRMHGHDGAPRWMHMSASPRAQGDGGVIWDGVLTDITEQREAERLARERDAQMISVLQHLPGGVVRVDQNERVLYVNPRQADWWRSTPVVLEGQPLADVLPRDLLARLEPPLKRALRGDTTTAELFADGRSGRKYWHVTLVPERIHGRDVASVMVFAYDITEQKRLAQELDQQRAQLAGLVNAIPDLVSLKDVQGRYLSGNPVFERYLGRREAQFIGMTDEQLLPAEQAQTIRAQDERAMAAWQPLVIEETLTFADDGYCGQFETVKTPMRDMFGRVTGLLSVSRDITERQRAAQEIERLAFYDALTGLPNRRLLLDRLERALGACQRQGSQGALLFIDLDNFKQLNDTLGHDMGDLLLAQVAQRLQTCVRETDTVARLGGDEFVVMLESLGESQHEAAARAEQVAGKLLDRLNQPFVLGAREHYSTPSVGVTLFGTQRCSVEDMLKRADLAMYQAKEAGRNTVRFFDPAMQDAVNERSRLEADLRVGLARGEFVMHLQPMVDGQARLCGAEALVRWQHPERGLLAPGQFIELAERTGLIVPLGQIVLQAACTQLAHWAQHEQTRHLCIAVNVSARQFRQPGFSDAVVQALEDSGADAERLKLELTESMLLLDVEDAVERMVQLKQCGVGFALDDFGTGYSSLSYLKRLPLDQLKIDRSFVRDVLTDPNDAAIVRTILALAHSLDLQVVAEGVESAAQMAFLKLHDCDGFQGYLFGKPCLPAQFAARYLDAAAGQGVPGLSALPT